LENDGSPKYQNTPDFPRAKVLYNWEGREGLPVIVESPMSVVSKDHLPGYHFIATFGAQVTDAQLRIMQGLEPVVLWFDNDPAGWNATSQVGDYLVSYTDVFVVNSPWNGDAGDLDEDTTIELLKGIVPYSLWQPPSQVKEWQS
jgi:DNA primase